MYEEEFELEALPEFEDELEWESEFEGAPAGEYEDELEYELEGEFEDEYEWELEGEYEGEYEEEAFFRRLAGLARRAVRSPVLRRIGLTAARSALGGLGPAGAAAARLLPQRELEGEFEGEFEDEYEYEWELEEEGEGEFNPVRRIYPDAPSAGIIHPARRVYPDALMEHLGHAAARAQSEAEAEAFIGALVPLAARLLPRAGAAIMRAAPGMIRGLSRVTRTLRRNPATRPLVRALPAVVRRTAQSVSQQAAQGRPVTPTTVVRTLARQTNRVLSSPRQAVAAYRQSCNLDRRYHRAAGGRPSPRPPAPRR